MAGIILGSGGPTGFAAGVAPAARFVDVKVLNDVGVGSGVAEALDWCIHNRDREWGADPAYRGIDVINLSLSSLDASDGNDAATRLANQAAELGIVVVASMGNEGRDHYVPSPAAGDRVIAVGAYDDQRSGLPGDDLFASFSDYGPRVSDGDGDARDELKPDLIAPGVGVLSADGDLASDGSHYQRLSGTSMAAAFVSGAVAALRSGYPALTPAAIADLLRATGYRPLGGLPSGVSGVDPGWYSPIGWGAVDLHAARLELVQPERSQVRRLELSGAGSVITATLRTQRERGAAFFVFERAPDVAGSPGTFAPYDSVAAAGDSTLSDGSNLRSYTRDWNVPDEERGVPFWYRVACTEAGVRWDGPARRFTGPLGPAAATVEVTVVHDAYDSDVDAAIELGAAGATTGTPGPSQPALSFPLPGSGAAVASEWVNGASTSGNIAWSFVVEIPHGGADAYLPPDPGAPCWLRVSEGGFLNRVGRVTRLRLVWHAPGGDQIYEGGPLPLQTIEGHTVYASAPVALTGVGSPIEDGGLRAGPNPVPAGGAVTFSLSTAPAGELRVFDLAGRAVGRASFRAGGDRWRAQWQARDAGGRPLPAGLYFARAGASAIARLIVLAR